MSRLIAALSIGVFGAACFVAGNATAAATQPDRSVLSAVSTSTGAAVPLALTGSESMYAGNVRALEETAWLLAVAASQSSGSGTIFAGETSGTAASTVPGSEPSSGGGSCYGGPVPDYIVTRESQGQPDVWNQGGSSAWGCFQILRSTWAASCSDLGEHGSASVEEQKACAARLPASAWSG